MGMCYTQLSGGNLRPFPGIFFFFLHDLPKEKVSPGSFCPNRILSAGQHSPLQMLKLTFIVCKCFSILFQVSSLRPSELNLIGIRTSHSGDLIRRLNLLLFRKAQML